MLQNTNNEFQSFTNIEDTTQLWTYKKLLDSLDSAKGIGTSVITYFLSPNANLNKANSQLQDALTSADRIKSCI
jgi:peptide subunit release factor 1 (eRF1)